MKTLIGLIVTVLIACPALSLAGEGKNAGGGTNEATTVKSSKSNSSERAGAAEGGQVGDGQAQDAAKVKGSKSNTSERSTVKSGKSNSSD